MWIMLIKKLPTEISPLKLSLFYSYKLKPTEQEIERVLKAHDTEGYVYNNFIKSHYIDEQAKKTFKRIERMDKIPDLFGWGYVPNELRAVWINYKNEKIKVYPHEYSIITPENLKLYMTNSHELVPDNYGTEQLKNISLTKGQRFIYDAALIDGCDEYQAMMVALGKDPSEIPPPIGWWRCKQEYAKIYCFDEEMTG